MLIMIMMILIILICLFMMILNLILSKKLLLDREKNSSFECGFNPFSSSRLPFSINFYLIGILFLIFDVEIIFLFPMIILMKYLNFLEMMYLSSMIMMILYLGLEFEKMEGSLKWIF